MILSETITVPPVPQSLFLGRVNLSQIIRARADVLIIQIKRVNLFYFCLG